MWPVTRMAGEKEGKRPEAGDRTAAALYVNLLWLGNKRLCADGTMVILMLQ